MAATRFKLDRKGVRKMMKGTEAQAAVLKVAKQIQARAGEGHKTEVYVGKTRARAQVSTTSRAALVAESENKNLTRAFGAQR